MNKGKRNRLILSILVGIIFLLAVFRFYTTFSLEDDYQIESSVYEITDFYIENISSNTDIDLFKKYFDLKNCSIEVVDESNEKVVSGYVKNGSKTVLYGNNHQVLGSYINIIKGDYNNDGIVDSNDFREMGKCLVQDCSLLEYQTKSVDIDGDLQFHINDLVLLDKAVSGGYTGISLDKDYITLQSGEEGRFVSHVQPSYGVNFNVKWVSDDNSIVSIDDAGRVIGNQEGSTIIHATTLDGKFTADAVVKVDNTIQLSSSEGIGYVGGNKVLVDVKLIDYDGVSCSVQNEDIASCEVQNKQLIIEALKQGNTTIKVTSPQYGEAIYSLTSYSVYLNVMPKYLCTTPNNIQYITISGFHSGNLSFESSDADIIKNAYMESVYNRNMLKIEVGSKEGRATLDVKESNGNSSNEVVVDVYRISIPQIGSIAKVGVDVSTTIVGGNLGILSCTVSDSSKAVCRIEGNQLIVTPLAIGNVTVDVTNQFSYQDSLYNCGKAQFLVVIQE